VGAEEFKRSYGDRSSLRIGLDATYTLDEQPTGVGIYCRELLRELVTTHPEAEFFYCYRPHRFFRAFRLSLPPRCHRRVLWEHWPAGHFALFHGLNQRLPRSRYPKTVVTFHDLFVMTGEYSSAEFRQLFARRAREAAGRADAIVAVSQFTARQVEELLQVPAARIRVIYHGVRLPQVTHTGSRERLVLHVGAIQRRKNLVRLVRAFAQLPEPWQLVLVGSKGYAAEEVFEAIAQSPVKDRIRYLGYLPPRQLEELYCRASMLAFPSLDEGFGLPVLEAMAHGTPVITSRRSALEEVAGDAALLVDPFDEEELAAALKRLAEDSTLWETLALRGRQRAAQFSWQKAATKTWELYCELLA